jgi:hypothetical protein
MVGDADMVWSGLELPPEDTMQLRAIENFFSRLNHSDHLRVAEIEAAFEALRIETGQHRPPPPTPPLTDRDGDGGSPEPSVESVSRQ